MGTMAPKYHPMPLSGGDRKALRKELVKSRAMACILAERAEEKRRAGEALIQEADSLACQSWNEKMWSDGGPGRNSVKMCNLYSITTNQAATAALFRVVNRYVGNLPPVPGVFLD